MEGFLLTIVGGGIGGAAAALRAAQYHIGTAWILGDRETRKSSRSAYVLNIDNMIGIHPGIVEEKIRERHDADAARQRDDHIHISTQDLIDNTRQRIAADYASFVRVVEDRAVGTELDKDGFGVTLAGGEMLVSPYLLLATGVMDRQPTIHMKRGGRDLSGIHWLFPYANAESLLYCIRCEGHLTSGRRVAVIGASNPAAEIALMLRERYGSQVTLVTAGEAPSWDEKRAKLLEARKVSVRTARLVDVVGRSKEGVLEALVLEDGDRLEVDKGLVAMGLERVYNDLAVQLGARLEDSSEIPGRRHVLVDRKAETNVRNLFAVGDMAQRPDETLMKQIYTAQEYAVRAVDTIDRRRRAAARESLLAT
jgi:thioredoxin reductase (NADPH)